jgi:DNA-directed RNA polymerase specialized sigma24 family protein
LCGVRHIGVSTPSKQRRAGAPSHSPAALARPVGAGHPDEADLLGLVARAKREQLLRRYRNSLRREDLEDCFSRATLELLASLRAGRRFSGRLHLGRVLEQRFVSRVRDRRRALHGRSALSAALEQALPLDACTGQAGQIADPRADVHALVARRHELRSVRAGLSALTPDQRLVLTSQAVLDEDRAEFCRRQGWSEAKYRKVAQRARTRLRALVAAELCLGGPAEGAASRAPSRKSIVPPGRRRSE